MTGSRDNLLIATKYNVKGTNYIKAQIDNTQRLTLC